MPQWDSNSQSQHVSGRRPTPYTAATGTAKKIKYNNFTGMYLIIFLYTHFHVFLVKPKHVARQKLYKFNYVWEYVCLLLLFFQYSDYDTRIHHIQVLIL